MSKKLKKYVKLAVVILVVCLFVWFLILYPLVSFKGYEKQMQEAAERYFVTKPAELPTGERIKTLTLQDLFYGAYLKEDFYIPYTKSPCSLKDSWVKVKRENGEYKYYTYLKCGVLSSKVDHKGPVINLNGDLKITATKGEEFKDPGVKSVVDNTDGEIDVKNVSVKGKVDTTKMGTYTLTYTALDSLNNKTEVKRQVEVVQRLKSTVKEVLKDKNNFKGDPDNNYIYFSSMLFRILDIDGDNVRIVSDSDISNVNYDGIDSWLDDVFYSHLSDDSKKLIVKNKYCNMVGSNLDVTKCTAYTKKRNVYIPSIVDANNTQDGYDNFLKTGLISWVSDVKDKENAYVMRSFFVETTDKFMAENRKFNLGVRPIITIKGDTLIKDGDGTADNPYDLGDVKKGKPNSPVSERVSGEYIQLNGYLFRVIESDNDGTTKVIATDSLYGDGRYIMTGYFDETHIYNPKSSGNVGYFINNDATEYIDSSYFVNKEIKVPIYKNDPNYGKETDTKKYKVKFSAPNTYDMFSAMQGGGSYWLINSSKNDNLRNAVSLIGVYLYDETTINSFGVRLVGYLKDNVTIVSGKGTYDNPYKISK